MTLKDLKQYRSICAEITETNIVITSGTVHGTVKGSDKSFPYITHTMSVGGMVPTEANEKLLTRVHDLEARKREIEIFIEGIEDSFTRRIFEMRFIKGFSWSKIAYRTNNTPDSVRMRCKRYVKLK